MTAAGQLVKRVWAREVADSQVLRCGRFLELRFTAATPQAVILAETTAPGGELMLARDLLYAGLRTGSARAGDVRISLVCPELDPVVLLAASWPGGEVELALDPKKVALFLAQAQLLVPAGREDEFTDVDGELREVLRVA